jgi:Transcriptional Coactivator p15 (PC4)
MGSAWFVTITSGVWCVDIRKHYKVNDGNQDDCSMNDDFLRPMRMGISLRFREWRALKEAMTAIDAARPDIASEEPCFHQNQQGKYIFVADSR